MKVESMKEVVTEKGSKFRDRNTFQYKVKIENIEKFQVPEELTERFSEMTEILWPNCIPQKTPNSSASC